MIKQRIWFFPVQDTEEIVPENAQETDQEAVRIQETVRVQENAKKSMEPVANTIHQVWKCVIVMIEMMIAPLLTIAITILLEFLPQAVRQAPTALLRVRKVRKVRISATGATTTKDLRHYVPNNRKVTEMIRRKGSTEVMMTGSVQLLNLDLHHVSRQLLEVIQHRQLERWEIKFQNE